MPTKPPSVKKTEIIINGKEIKFAENEDLIVNDVNISQQIREIQQVIAELTDLNLEN